MSLCRAVQCNVEVAHHARHKELDEGFCFFEMYLSNFFAFPALMVKIFPTPSMEMECKYIHGAGG